MFSRSLTLTIMALALLVGIPAYADDSLDEIMGGFSSGSDLDAVAEDTQVEPSIKSGPFQLNGNFTLFGSYNYMHNEPAAGQTDYRGLSALSAEAYLEGRYVRSDRLRLYLSGRAYHDASFAIHGRDDYTDEVLDARESELELQEAYLDLTLTDYLDLIVGRQIATWGKSDNIRVTDLLNPLDLSAPGMTDIKSLRLPVAMARMNFYSGRWTTSGMYIYEQRSNRLPAYGSDFYAAPMPPPDEQEPSEAQYALSASGFFAGWDIALYYARYNNRMPSISKLTSTPQSFELVHDNLTMYGGAVNVVSGSWLLKAELADTRGFEFLSSPGNNYRRTDYLAGFEYGGFVDTTISLECAVRHLNDWQSSLRSDSAIEDEVESALRLTRTFAHNTISATILAIRYGADLQGGGLSRFEVTEDWSDTIKFSAGVVDYQSGDYARFKSIGDRDRVFARATYSF